jgi:hypothetical protein
LQPISMLSCLLAGRRACAHCTLLTDEPIDVRRIAASVPCTNPQKLSEEDHREGPERALIVVLCADW